MAPTPKTPSSPANLATDVQYAKHAGPATGKLLRKLGIRTIRDLFYHAPAYYRDLSQIKKVSKVEVGAFETLRLQVHEVQVRKVGFWKTRLDVRAGDDERKTGQDAHLLPAG